MQKIKEYYIKEEKRYNLVQKQKNYFIQKQEEALRILDSVQEKYEEFRRNEDEKIFKLLEEENKKKTENAANASSISNNKVIVDSPISNNSNSQKQISNNESLCSISSSVTPYTPISIKYDNNASPDILVLKKKSYLQSEKRKKMTKTIFKDNYGESNNKNSVFAFNCYEGEKDLNKIGNDELLKTPFKRCYKKFKTGKLNFRDIDKEMLLKGVNNNNNNEVNNSSNYNKKEYEKLAKAIEIFKLNRDKEIENEEKEDKDEKENIDEKKENEKSESNNKKEDDNNNEIKRN